MPSADKMAATEVVGDQQQGSSVSAQPSDTLESLRREAEQLKAKLEEERAKLTDVDRKIIWLVFTFRGSSLKTGPARPGHVKMTRKDYTMCTAAKTYEIGQNRLKLAE